MGVYTSIYVYMYVLPAISCEIYPHMYACCRIHAHTNKIHVTFFMRMQIQEEGKHKHNLYTYSKPQVRRKISSCLHRYVRADCLHDHRLRKDVFGASQISHRGIPTCVCRHTCMYTCVKGICVHVYMCVYRNRMYIHTYTYILRLAK